MTSALGGDVRNIIFGRRHSRASAMQIAVHLPLDTRSALVVGNDITFIRPASRGTFSHQGRRFACIGTRSASFIDSCHEDARPFSSLQEKVSWTQDYVRLSARLKSFASWFMRGLSARPVKSMSNSKPSMLCRRPRPRLWVWHSSSRSEITKAVEFTCPRSWSDQELYGNARNPEFMRAISEGLEWAKQNNLLVRDLTQQHEWHVLSRSGERFNSQRDLPVIHLERLLPTEILHPSVRSSSLGIFRAGHFEAAVFEAFKVLEVAIREAAATQNAITAPI